MLSLTRLVAFSSALVAAAPITTSPNVDVRISERRGPMNFVLGPGDSGHDPLFLPRSDNATLLARRTNTNYKQDYTTGGTVNFSPTTNDFSVSWSTTDDFVVGVGWNPGSTAAITHSGTFSVTSGSASLSVYGWTTSPLVEYYVMEYDDGISMSTATYKGSVSSDGGTYSIYEATRTNAPSIQGTSTFNQYISVRTSGTSSGTVTIQNHFNAWAALGMNLGTLNLQVVAVESWNGAGSASQSVSN